MNRTSRLFACVMLVVAACQKSGVHGLGSSADAPQQLAFGDVMVGAQRRMPLKISNDSLNAFELVGAEVEPPFSTLAAPTTIEPSGSLTVDVIFTPDSGKPFE